MKTWMLDGLRCDAEQGTRPEICYILSYNRLDEGWMQQTAMKYGCSVVVITNIDWNDALSPWPAEGVPAGAPPFRGGARQFLDSLVFSVMPQIEQELGCTSRPRRTIVGVSMSGLFALWAWLSTDTFDDTGSISGSFWFDGFAQWVSSQPLDHKTGKVYLSVGRGESRSRVRAFRSVVTDTLAIAETLHSHGVDVDCRTTGDDHFSPIYPRLDSALHSLFAIEPPRE